MTHDAPSTGVLVLDTDISVRQVDEAALSLLDVSRTTLLDDTATVLHEPISDAEGTTFSSLREYLCSLLENSETSGSIVLSNEICATARVTYDADDPNGFVLTLRPPSSADVSSPSSESPSSTNKRLFHAQSQLLETIAQGASLSEILTDLISFIESERPGMLGSVLLMDPDTQTLHHGAAPSLPASYVETIDGLSIGPTAGSCGAAAHRGKTIIATDIETDERWGHFRSVALDHELHACWSTPIYGEDNEILGTFALYYDEPRAPTEHDRTLIAEASRLASVAIEYDRHKRALRLQREQFQRLVENAQPVVLLLDTEGTVLLAEGEDLGAVDLKPDEIVGESIYELYEEHPILLEYVDRALDGETVDATVEIEGVLFDIWYSPYYDRNGDVAGCIGMGVDITERREAERALRSNRDLLRRTQEMVHVGGWEYDPQTDAMVGTEETYRIYEVPLDAELTLEQSLTFYSPEIAAKLKASAKRCLTHGEPFDLEAPITTDAGTERWVRIRGEAQHADDGTIAKMVGTVQDLTERHEMEVELRKQKEWLQSITENISGGIYRSTKDEGLVYANQAFLDLFGYESLQEILDASIHSLYANPDVRQELIQRENEQGGLDGIEVEYRRKDGSTFIGLLRSTQVTDDDGEPRYYDGVITDITEQKVRERKFRDQRRKIEAMYESSGRLLQANSRKEVASLLTTLLTDTFGYPGVVVRGVEDDQLVPVSAKGSSAKVAPQPVSLTESSLLAEIFRDGETRIVDVQEQSNPVLAEHGNTIAGVPLGRPGLLTLAKADETGIEAFDLRLIDILAHKATAVLSRI
jgi:PAS domain S-box-containing protein